MKRLLKGLLLTLGAVVVACIVGAVVMYFQYGKHLYVPQDGPAHEIVVRGGTLFDGTSSRPIPNPGIVVRGGKISCIGVACEAGADAIEIDATGFGRSPQAAKSWRN